MRLLLLLLLPSLHLVSAASLAGTPPTAWLAAPLHQPSPWLHPLSVVRLAGSPLAA